MNKRIPADEVPEQLAVSPAGTVTAACLGVGNADKGGGHEEVDEYDQLLASLGRTEEHDQRVAIHELSHFFINRLVGNSSIDEVTITPGDGYDGCGRGKGARAVRGRRPAPTVPSLSGLWTRADAGGLGLSSRNDADGAA